jgi:hypothetical protein
MHRLVRLATVALISAASFAADFTGTWKLNPAKSKLSPHSEIAGSVTKIEKTGANTYRVQIDHALKSGGNRRLAATRICDGKEHRDEASPSPTMYTCDAATFNHTFKRDGKLFSEIVMIPSAEKNTHTARYRLFGPDGKAVAEELRFHEKQ